MSSTNEPHPLLRRVEQSLRGSGVRRGDGLLLGLSGGPDSTALACLLAELRRWRLDLVGCYVDHGMRERSEIEGELAFVRALGERLGFPVLDASIPPGEIAELARRSKKSLEHVARERRYAIFAELLSRRSLGWIAVGHTLDDHIETILMRVLQGGGVSGLKGIPERRGRIVRPLLRITREEVLRYLGEQGQQYRSDSSNLRDDFLRNRIRNRLIPVVRELFPGFRRSLAGFARQARLVDAHIEAAAAGLGWQQRGEGFRISASRFLRAAPEVRARSILALFNRNDVGGRIPRGFLRPLLELRAPQGKWDTRRQLLASGYGATIERRGEWLWWGPAVVLSGKKGYLIEVRGVASFRVAGRLTIRALSEAVKELPADAVQVERGVAHGPLIIRSRRTGDRIQLGERQKSVKRLLAEWRVPEQMRWLVPVVEDREGIVAVLGKGLGFKDCVATRRSKGSDLPRAEGRLSLCAEYSGEEGE